MLRRKKTFSVVIDGQRIAFCQAWVVIEEPIRARRKLYHPHFPAKKLFVSFLALALALYPAYPAFVFAGSDPEEEMVAQNQEEEGEEADEQNHETESDQQEEQSEEKSDDAEDSMGEVGEEDSEEPEQLLTIQTEAPITEEGGDGGAETTIENENDAVVESEVVAGSDTGGNEIVVTEESEEPEEPQESLQAEEEENGEENDVSIETGDAGAAVVLIQDVNTNIVGTGIGKEVVTVGGGSEEDVDLLEDFSSLEAEEETDGSELPDGCPDGECGISVENTNTAEVTSTVTAVAETGDNSITGGGDAEIETGDAQASAAAVNIVNTNLVGMNGLLAVINIVGEYLGDIIVPGQGLLGSGGSGSGVSTVENENEAVIENTVAASADTGGNSIEGAEGDAEIDTGDASASAGSVTMVNTNYVGDDWFLLFVNGFGSWSGSVIDGEDAELGEGVYGYSFGDGAGDEGCETGCDDIVSVTNRNTAHVVNTVTASASTGGNTIEGSGDASIRTGDATASAAAFNFVNNNIVGSNWLLGIINIFGSWTGNLVFAYPDLEVSIDDDADTVLPGAELTQTITVKNIGKAPAKDARLTLHLPDGEGFSGSSLAGYSGSGGTFVWEFPGGLAPGESRSLSVASVVASDAPDGKTFTTSVSAETGTTEKHTGNNADSASVTVDIPSGSGGGEIVFFDAGSDDDVKLSIKRSMDAPVPAREGSLVTHKITVKNTGDVPLFDVELTDDFFSPEGSRIGYYFWDIGDLDHGKGVLVTYSVIIPVGAPQGEYRYTARADAEDPYEDAVKSRKVSESLSILSVIATTVGLAPETAFAGEAPVPPVEAALPSGEVAGVVVESRAFPLWMLLLSGFAYYLMINWSFFPRNQKRYEDL